MKIIYGWFLLPVKGCRNWAAPLWFFLLSNYDQGRYFAAQIFKRETEIFTRATTFLRLSLLVLPGPINTRGTTKVNNTFACTYVAPGELLFPAPWRSVGQGLTCKSIENYLSSDTCVNL